MSDFEYDYLGSLSKRNAILLCHSDERRQYLKLLAQTYQCVIMGYSIDENSSISRDKSLKNDNNAMKHDDMNDGVDLLLIDLPSDMEFNYQELSEISVYILKNQIEAVVWTNIDDLDEIFALLPSAQCHFITDPNPLEAMPALTGLTGRDVMSHLSDISQDDSNEKEYAALHRISSELASLAKTLAQIAVIDDMTISETQKSTDIATKQDKSSYPEDFMNHSVFKDKPTSFTPFPSSASSSYKSQMPHSEQSPKIGHQPPKKENTPQQGHRAASPFIDNGDKFPSHNSAINADRVRTIIKQRRMRENFFESALFADPAWDIMLDLMAARLSGQTVSVSSLCIAAAVPATTALRWITSMTKNGMLERKSDPMDARRVFIDLSDTTFDTLEAYLIKTLDSQAPII